MEALYGACSGASYNNVVMWLQEKSGFGIIMGDILAIYELAHNVHVIYTCGKVLILLSIIVHCRAGLSYNSHIIYSSYSVGEIFLWGAF